jgi:hypothetical protein
MSTFYLLPARPFLGRCFAGYLQSVFPGLHWEQQDLTELAETLTAVAGAQAEVYVVHREEIPEGEELFAALKHGFGAETGDVVVEVRPDANTGEFQARRWRLDGPERTGGIPHGLRTRPSGTD